MSIPSRFALLGTSLGLLVGCSRPNPAFDTGASGGSSGADTSEEGPSASTRATAVGATTSGNSATSDTTMGVGSGSTSTPPPSTSGDSEEDSGPGLDCQTGPGTPIDIDILGPMDETLAPDCAAPLVSGVPGLIDADTDVFTFRPCLNCLCGKPTGAAAYTFEFTGLTLPDLPSCAQFVAWAAYGVTGDCEWVGVALTTANVSPMTAPVFVASNARNLPSLPFIDGGLQVQLALDTLCPNDRFQCFEDQRGLYELQFGDNDPLPVGMTESMTTEFSNTPYMVTNHISWVDNECYEHVAWDAVQE